MTKPRKPEYAEKYLLDEMTELSLDGQESLEKLLAYIDELEEYTEDHERHAGDLEATVERLQAEANKQPGPDQRDQAIKQLNEHVQFLQAKLNAITLVMR